MPAQAVAAHWAASCSHGTAWQHAFLTKPGLTALETAFSTLLERHAVERFPKPGGWSYTQWEDMCVRPKAFRSKQQQKLHEQMMFGVVVKHTLWQQRLLKPALKRYNIDGSLFAHSLL